MPAETCWNQCCGDCYYQPCGSFLFHFCTPDFTATSWFWPIQSNCQDDFRGNYSWPALTIRQSATPVPCTSCWNDGTNFSLCTQQMLLICRRVNFFWHDVLWLLVSSVAMVYNFGCHHTSRLQVTFFYPSTEWDMDEPFQCMCGTDKCLGRIAGAKQMPRPVLDQYKLNSHILAKLNGL